MKAHMRHAAGSQHTSETTADEIRRLDWPTDLASEYQVDMPPDWPEGYTLLVLTGSVLLQNCYQFRRKRNRTTAMPRLGLLELETLAELVPKRCADLQRVM